MNLRLHIDTLSIVGTSLGDRDVDTLRNALESQLAEMLTANGRALTTAQPRLADHAIGSTLELPRNASADSFGRGIADSLGGALGVEMPR